jgi:hypothetical protein
VHLVQLLLPLFSNEGEPFGQALFAQVEAELAERFGGVTAFTRAPADGRWRNEAEGEVHDEVVLFEAMVERLDEAWWGAYRRALEGRFRQDTVLIRATEVRLL